MYVYIFHRTSSSIVYNEPQFSSETAVHFLQLKNNNKYLQILSFADTSNMYYVGSYLGSVLGVRVPGHNE